MENGITKGSECLYKRRSPKPLNNDGQSLMITKSNMESESRKDSWWELLI